MALVVFVMIDGVRPDAIAASDCPTLTAMQAEGAWTMQATSVMPSITLPCHMSIFHSVPPTRHGITTNEWVPMARPLPGLFDLAHAAGRRCASFYNWEPLRNLSRPESLDFAFYCDAYQRLPDADTVIATEAVRHMTNDRPDFGFVYFGTVDIAGHVAGWMSDAYLAQLARVDGALGLLMAGLPPDTSYLVHSDHGGHERTHGNDIPEDMTIPWLVKGPSIRRGHQIQQAVNLIDTAPTLAKLLRLTPHRDWEGMCINEIFTPG